MCWTPARGLVAVRSSRSSAITRRWIECGKPRCKGLLDSLVDAAAANPCCTSSTAKAVALAGRGGAVYTQLHQPYAVRLVQCRHRHLGLRQQTRGPVVILLLIQT